MQNKVQIPIQKKNHEKDCQLQKKKADSKNNNNNNNGKQQ